MRTTLIGAAFALACGIALPLAQTKPASQLTIYVADTEGGKAALFVTPSGETVLIDAGNPGPRDGDRIVAMIEGAGVKQIDHLISTHYHVDHVGGMFELAKRIPIRHYVDHGPNVEPKEQVANFTPTYTALHSAAKHTVVKPGDRLPIAGLDWRIITSAGKAITAPLPGGGQANPECSTFAKKNNAGDENAQSVGSLVTFGQFKLIDLGDLVWDVEYDFVCPRNLVGPVDLYMVSHHGLEASGSPQFVKAIQPRVAVMQNGTRKGGAPGTFQTMRSSARLEDIWALHWSYTGMIEHNPAGVFIANVDDMPTIAAVLTAPPPAPRGGGGGGRGAAAPTPGAPAPVVQGQQVAPQAPPNASAPAAGGPAPAGGGGRGGGQAASAHSPAYIIKIAVSPDGTFTVTNSRNTFSKTYRK